ncbi:MAG: type II toxin-antitoxin system PemK/MazF family toxin [Verrucomicrobiae bacterium]|nr:type II toxin-antitoxin system PemK/MazF family toxin [Verrucomicrobiae bacterium]MDW8309345.1 type II toxin-antitoxin system PemK/MazF family toxin [Verrucomicrobiales bacterium]
MRVPQRGEVWLADLGMVGKVRPVLVMNVPFSDRDYALFHVVPHTTTVRDSQFDVRVDVPWLAAGVFNVQGGVSVTRRNLLRPLGTLSATQMADVEETMRRWLGL